MPALEPIDSECRRLPASEWKWYPAVNRDGHAIVGAHVRDNVVKFSKIKVSELPENLATIDDLESAVFALIDGRPVV